MQGGWQQLRSPVTVEEAKLAADNWYGYFVWLVEWEIVISHHSMKMATWNVRGLNQAFKQREIRWLVPVLEIRLNKDSASIKSKLPQKGREFVNSYYHASNGGMGSRGILEYSLSSMYEAPLKWYIVRLFHGVAWLT
ncbi:hypothetical protein Ancab_011116, partial [Ancistrocladus abbreviatus]